MHARNFIDLTGQKFGHWTVLALRMERGRYRHFLWLCRCDCCGEERVVRGDTLRRGKSTSCGCTQQWDEERREKQRETAKKRFTTHGLSRSRAYVCWTGIKQRCLNPNNPGYPDYGERGIKPCDDWLGFENFYADRGDPPDGLSIHRIDNDGNYEPTNCIWAPPSVQNATRRRRPINVVKLKERIASGGPIKPRERNFILDCIDACAPPADGFVPPPF